MADLLLELFSEEIPARMQKRAAEDLSNAVLQVLKDSGLSHDSAVAYATPRRLALNVTGIPDATADTREERRGPKVGAPDKAIGGFLRGAGIAREALEERETPKGVFYYAVIEKTGVATADVLAEAMPTIIRNFPWPKSQRWGAGSLKWVRPLHSILALIGDAALDFEVSGIKAGNQTSGHRFMAPAAFSVADFADYKAKLQDAFVMLDPADRAALIAEKAQELAKAAGLTLVEDAGLLAEVAGLVEWPVPLLASFDADFLKVPEEVLQLTMKKDQKYFALRQADSGAFAPNFITVANIVASDGGAVIALGNQKVIAARLADAKFFWQQDLKSKLDDLLPNLKHIVFHAKLGTVAERAERVRLLAGELAQYIPGCDKVEAERAAELAKADLTSKMVGEFPEVQGVMGRYYALEQGETAAVADAIRDHYAPKGPSDACPSAPVSVAVALAEKLDVLTGFFAVDEKPTGSKDPFALRRAALGVIRLITENSVRISLAEVISKAISSYGATFDAPNILDISADLMAFFADRLKVQQREKGMRHDLIDAVFSLGGEDDLVRLLARVDALQEFIGSDDGVNLLAAFKRANNILAKSGDFDRADPCGVNEEPAELALVKAMYDMGKEVTVSLKSENYLDVMTRLAELREPIDRFFEEVMVNVDDITIRNDRLSMMSAFVNVVNRVADFSKIEG